MVQIITMACVSYTIPYSSVSICERIKDWINGANYNYRQQYQQTNKMYNIVRNMHIMSSELLFAEWMCYTTYPDKTNWLVSTE